MEAPQDLGIHENTASGSQTPLPDASNALLSDLPEVEGATMAESPPTRPAVTVNSLSDGFFHINIRQDDEENSMTMSRSQLLQGPEPNWWSGLSDEELPEELAQRLQRTFDMRQIQTQEEAVNAPQNVEQKKRGKNRKKKKKSKAHDNASTGSREVPESSMASPSSAKSTDDTVSTGMPTIPSAPFSETGTPIRDNPTLNSAEPPMLSPTIQQDVIPNLFSRSWAEEFGECEEKTATEVELSEKEQAANEHNRSFTPSASPTEDLQKMTDTSEFANDEKWEVVQTKKSKKNSIRTVGTSGAKQVASGASSSSPATISTIRKFRGEPATWAICLLDFPKHLTKDDALGIFKKRYESVYDGWVSSPRAGQESTLAFVTFKARDDALEAYVRDQGIEAIPGTGLRLRLEFTRKTMEADPTLKKDAEKFKTKVPMKSSPASTVPRPRASLPTSGPERRASEILKGRTTPEAEGGPGTDDPSTISEREGAVESGATPTEETAKTSSSGSSTSISTMAANIPTIAKPSSAQESDPEDDQSQWVYLGFHSSDPETAKQLKQLNEDLPSEQPSNAPINGYHSDPGDYTFRTTKKRGNKFIRAVSAAATLAIERRLDPSVIVKPWLDG
ncbi:MAG: hypothetical protein M1820_010207 [Bogoriella megaspora]|nr:MAG: hypothetical protein M1820_010207 [Bogoriella megaspora]